MDDEFHGPAHTSDSSCVGWPVKLIIYDISNTASRGESIP